MGAATTLRDRAFRLAPIDADAALVVARENPEPWFRAQALAAVARHVAKHRAEAIARESIAAAAQGKDDYQRAAVSAWPKLVFTDPTNKALPSSRGWPKTVFSASSSIGSPSGVPVPCASM